jgi:hypothetical protein
MFGSFLGCAGGQGTKEGNKNSLVNWDPTIFDNKDATGEFANQLLPQHLGLLSPSHKWWDILQCHRGGRWGLCWWRRPLWLHLPS